MAKSDDDDLSSATRSAARVLAQFSVQAGNKLEVQITREKSTNSGGLA